MVTDAASEGGYAPVLFGILDIDFYEKTSLSEGE
jgi:hypothetical protein